MEDKILGIIEKLCNVEKELLHYVFELTETAIRSKEAGELDEKRVN